MDNQEKEQRLIEIARIRSGNDNYDPKLIQSLDKAIKAQTAFGVQNLQLSEEEAEEKAIHSLKVASTSNKRSGLRKRNKEAIKKALKYFSEQGKDFVSANEVTEWVVEQELYHTNSPKGIGDIMGRGRNGFFLEEGETKVDGRKVLKIPVPGQFPNWYEADVPLPKNYYSDSYWEKLLAEEGASTHSTFFEDRI